MSSVIAPFAYHAELIDGREIPKPLPNNLHSVIQGFLIQVVWPRAAQALPHPS